MGMMIDIGDGLKVPAEVVGTTSIDGYGVEVLAVFDESSGRYMARRVTVAVEVGEVTGTVMRSVAVERVLGEVLADTLDAALSGVRLPERIEDGPTDETLRYVALAYRVALLLVQSPTKTVAEQLQIPRSTAGRWVTRARDRGLLNVVDKHGRTPWLPSR